MQTLMTDQYKNCVRDVSWHPTQPAQLVSTSVSWTSSIACAVTTSYLLCFFVYDVFSPVATLFLSLFCFCTSTSHSPSLSLSSTSSPSPSLHLSLSLSLLLYLPPLSLSPSLSVPLASSLPPPPTSCMVAPGAVGWHSTAMDSQQETRLCTRPTETLL